MKKNNFTLTADDGHTISCASWLPGGRQAVRGIIQIAHGMAEYKDRYEEAAEALTGDGFAVYANDHRGHGQGAKESDSLGFFAEEEGWTKVVTDMLTLTQQAKESHPEVPFFLLGHSMGSFLSRSYAIQHGGELDGLLLSGTGADKGLLGKIGLLLARREIKKKGARHVSLKLNALSFGSFNKAFEPNRTAFDWLSRDTAIVDRYVEDPLCGFVCTSQFFADLLSGIRSISEPENIKKIPQNLPIYLFSGAMDPVGDQGKGVQAVAEQYRRGGVKNVTVKLYPEARHEIMNETNRNEVYKDILSWLNVHIRSRETSR